MAADLTLGIEVDEDGIVFLVTTKREAIGHVADPSTGYLVPDELEADYQAEVESYEEGQRNAIGAREAAIMAHDRAVGRVTG